MKKTTLTIDIRQLLALGRLLRDTTEAMQGRLDAEVQRLPPGYSQWADTAEELELLRRTLLTVENAIHEAGA